MANKLLPGLFVLLTACNNGFMERNDRIVFTECAPAIVLKSVQDYEYFDAGVCTGRNPIPFEASVTHRIDLDQDGKDDFTLEVQHGRNTGYCGHCNQYRYASYISTLHDKAGIAAEASDSYTPKIFEAGQNVTKKENWISGATLSLNSCGTSINPLPAGGAYIGLSVEKRQGYMYLDYAQDSLSIIEYAYNDRRNKEIVCGQRD